MKKDFKVGDYVRISPHLRKMYPNYWVSVHMFKYAGMIAKVEKLNAFGEVYLGSPTKSGYIWHPALLERVRSEIIDGDKL